MPNYEHMELGTRIAKVRGKLGMTQLQVASKAAIDPQHLSRIERGVVGSPGMETIERIAKALGMTLPELYSAR